MKLIVYAPLVMVATLAVSIGLNTHFENLTKAFSKATTHQVEPVTELYFKNYAELPKKLTLGTAYPVSFVIANHTGQFQLYKYHAYIIEDQEASLLQSNLVTISDGNSDQQTVIVKPKKANKHIKIIIRLLGDGQEIRYSTST